MEIRRLGPDDASDYRAVRMRALWDYEAAGFRSFGIEPRAIQVDGRFHGKNHMALLLNP